MSNKDKMLCAMIDVSRNGVMKVEQVERFAKTIREMGYNAIGLYMEDVYEIDGEPYFGHLRGRYSKSELKRINDYCKNIGITAIPFIQTLAHLNGIFKWREYSDINDISDILLIDDEKTYALIDKMFATMRCCFDSERINIGMDEAWSVGLGKYLAKHGIVKNRVELIYKHLIKVLEIARKYKFKCTMWGDMFRHLGVKEEEIRNYVPSDLTLCYWNYYNTDEQTYDVNLKYYKNATKNVSFAGGAWTWSGFAPRNSWTIQTMRSAISACRKNDINDFTVTMWGDDGQECSPFAVLPSLYFCAEKYLNDTSDEIIKEKFNKQFDVVFDDFVNLDMPHFYNGLGINCALYADPFCGLYDYHISVGDGKACGKYAEKMSGLANKKNEYGYLFENAVNLARVIELKYDLGVKTREAYKNRDKKELNSIAENLYPEIILRVEKFYEGFCRLWMKEYKPYGLEIQQIRLGGLKARLIFCQSIIRDYLTGKISNIEELETPVIPYVKGVEKSSIDFDHQYALTVSANRLGW